MPKFVLIFKSTVHVDPSVWTLEPHSGWANSATDLSHAGRCVHFLCAAGGRPPSWCAMSELPNTLHSDTGVGLE